MRVRALISWSKVISVSCVLAMLLVGCSPGQSRERHARDEIDRLLHDGNIEQAYAMALAERDASPNNLEIQFTFAYTADMSNKVSEAKDAYERCIAMSGARPDIQIYSKRMLGRVLKQLEWTPEQVWESATADEYFLLDSVRTGILKWSLAGKPIRVYYLTAVDNPQKYVQLGRSGVQCWASAAADVVKFVEVAKQTDADLIVEFVDNPDDPRVSERSGTTNYRTDEKLRSRIRGATVVVLTKDHMSVREESDQSIVNTVVHEIGHALGLGHSKNPKDCMFPSSVNKTSVSAGDTAMLRRLYKGVPRALLAEAVAVANRLLGSSHPFVIHLNTECMSLAADEHRGHEVIAIAEKILAAAQGSTNEKVLQDACWAAQSSGYQLHLDGKPKQALPIYKKAVAAACSEKDRIESEGFLAKCYLDLDDLASAEKLYLRQVSWYDARHESTPDLALALFCLGYIYETKERFNKALPLYERACRVYDALNVHDEDAVTCRDNLRSLKKWYRSG